MRKILMLLLFFFIAKTSFCQAPNWLWAIVPTGGTCYETGFGISANSSGYLYVAGRFDSTINFGSVNASTLKETIVSGKLNTSGSFSWLSTHSYSNKMEYVYGFTRDNADYTYTTGKLGSDTGGIYVDKYNSLGTLSWYKIISGGGIGGGYGVAVDDSSNVYITGEYSGSVNFSNPPLTSQGESDVFLAKYNSAGTLRWAVSAGGVGYDGARGIVLDKDRNIYICGGYSGSPVFGTIHASPASPNDQPDFFIAKYNSSGVAQWVSSATNAGFRTNDPFWSMQSIAIDTCANLYVTGHFVGKAVFGNSSITSIGGDDIFVAKCRNNGTWDWASRAGGPGNDNGSGIVLDKNYDIYLTGSFEQVAQFGNYWVKDSGLSDVYVAKYSNTSGDVQWVQTGGGKNNDAGIGISLDNYGYAYIIGISGKGKFGTYNITNASKCGSIFIAKLDTSKPLKIIVDPDVTYCSGGSVGSLSFATEGTFNSGNIFTAQISDSGGNFGSNPKSIGSYTGTVSGTIPITMPPVISSGHYRIRVISSNPSWCSYSSSCGNFVRFETVSDSVGSVSAVRDIICQGTPANLTYSYTSAHSDAIQWQYSTLPNADFTNITGATNSTYKTGPILHFGDNYYRVVLAEGDCTFFSDSIQIDVPPTLTASFYYLHTDPAQLTFNSDSSIGNITSYHWDFGDGTTSSLRNPIHTFPKDTTYYVCLTLYDGSNCSSTFCRYCVPKDTVIIVMPSSSYPPGSISDVPINLNTLYNQANRFEIQMSNISGAFTAPINIGVAHGTTANNLSIKIPLGTPSGTYNIRLKTTSPAGFSGNYSITVP